MHLSSRLIIALALLSTAVENVAACERRKAMARDKRLVNKRLELVGHTRTKKLVDLVADDRKAFSNQQTEIAAAELSILIANPVALIRTAIAIGNNSTHVVFPKQQNQLLNLKAPRFCKKAIMEKRNKNHHRSHHNQRVQQPRPGY